MAAILATVDIEDLATPKVTAVKDALSDLTRHVEQLSRTMSGVTGSLQAGADALGASATQSHAAAEGFRAVQQSVNALTPQLSGIVGYLQAVGEQAEAVQAALVADAQQVQVLSAALANLTGTLQAGKAATDLEVSALRELAEAAAAGNGFTAEQARTLADLYAQIAKGIPLTEEQIQQLQEVAVGYADANREALGLSSAIQQLIADHQQSQAAIQENATALGVLASTLQEGVTLTTTQAAALRELAQRAQEGNGFSEEQARILKDINETVAKGLPLSRQQIGQLLQVEDAYRRLNIAGEQALSTTERFRLSALLLAAALAKVAAGIVGYLGNAVELAARIQTLGTVMAVTAKNANLSTLELNTQVEAVKRLGITTKEANDTVLKFVQAELKASDAARVARVAQDLAVVAGENSSQTVDRLTRAIQTQQPLLLRAVGITTGLEQIYRAYAVTVGKTVTQLTQHEKQQAFLNKIMEQGAKVAGAYEASMDTASKMQGSMARLTEELSLKIGQGLLPLYTIWVKLNFELLTGLNKFPPVFFAVAAGLGLVVAGVVAVQAAIMTGMLPAIKELILASRAFLATPIGLGIMAIAVAVGLGVTAWAEYTKSTKEVADQLISDAAKREAQLQLISDQVKAIKELKAANDTSVTGVAALEQAYSALAKTAPQAVKQVSGELQIQNDWITKNIEKQRQLNREAALGLTALREQSEADLKAKREEADQAAARTAATRQRLAEAEARLANTASRPEAERLRDRNAVDALRKQLADLAKAEGALVAERGALASETARLTRAERELKATYDVNEAASLKLEDTTAALHDLYKKFGGETQVRDVFKKLGVDMAFLDQMTDKNRAGWGLFVEALKKVFDALPDVESELDRIQRESEARRRAAEAAYKAALDNIRGTSARVEGQLEGTNAAFKEVAKGAKLYMDTLGSGADGLAKYNQLSAAQQKLVEDYIVRLQRGSAAIAQFNKLTDAQQKELTDLGIAAKALEQVQLDKLFREWQNTGIDAAQKVREAWDQTVMSLQQEFRTSSRQADAAIQQQLEDATERARVMEQEAADAVGDVRMSQMELAIRAEHRRVDDIERQIHRERELRDRALKEEEVRLAERFEHIRSEALARLSAAQQDITLKSMQEQAAIRLQAAEERWTDARRDARLKIAEDARKQFNEQVQIETQRVLTDTRREEEKQRAIIQRQRAANKESDAIIDAALKKQREASDVTVRRIIANYDELRVLLKGVMEESVTAFASGLTRMLTTMKGWKEGFVDIWHSIRDSFFRIVDDMVAKWVKSKIMQMFLPSNVPGGGGGGMLSGITQSAAGRFLGNLLGIGGGGALAASGPVWTTAAGGAGGTLAAGHLAGAYGTAAPGAVTSGLAAGTPWYATAAGSGAVAGGAGFGAGFVVGKMTGSRTAGALAGAGTGALTGLMLGGPVGALIGGGIGLIGGLLGGGEAGRVKKAREELIKSYGDIDTLKKKADAAGYSLDRMLSTKKMKDFQQEARNLDVALKAGGMDELRRKADAVGESIDHIFAIRDQKKFEEAMDRLNKKLEEQQRRIAALVVAAQGLALRAEGFKEAVAKDMEGIYNRLGTTAREALQRGFAAAQKRGFEGTQLEFMRQQLEKVAEGGFNNFKLPARAINEYRKSIEDAQEDFATLGTIAAATFAQILKETGDLNAAMAAVGPTLDMMIEQQDALGLESSETFRQLLNFRRVIKDNEDISKSISGITQVLKGLSDAGALTQDLFSAIGTDVSRQFDRLIGRGVDTQMALLMLQPTLQKLYEAQQKYGYVVDANTQRLLDQAKAQGLVGEKFKETNDKILDVLVAIGHALGATIPDGIDKTADRARQRFPQVEEDVNALAYGRSPGGIAGFTEELERAQSQLDTFHNAAVGNLRDTERAIDSTAGALTTLSAPDDLGTNVVDFSQWIRNHREQNQLGQILPPEGALIPPQIDPATGLPVAPVPVGEGEPGVTVGESGQVVINMPITIDASALDGRDMARVFSEQIVPQLKTDLERNTAQLAAYMEQRLVRYRTSSTAVIRTRAPRT